MNFETSFAQPLATPLPHKPHEHIQENEWGTNETILDDWSPILTTTIINCPLPITDALIIDLNRILYPRVYLQYCGTNQKQRMDGATNTNSYPPTLAKTSSLVAFNLSTTRPDIFQGSSDLEPDINNYNKSKMNHIHNPTNYTEYALIKLFSKTFPKKKQN